MPRKRWPARCTSDRDPGYAAARGPLPAPSALPANHPLRVLEAAGPRPGRSDRRVLRRSAASTTAPGACPRGRDSIRASPAASRRVAQIGARGWPTSASDRAVVRGGRFRAGRAAGPKRTTPSSRAAPRGAAGGRTGRELTANRTRGLRPPAPRVEVEPVPVRPVALPRPACPFTSHRLGSRRHACFLDRSRLGLVSLLTDASSEMIFPLLPSFLTGGRRRSRIHRPRRGLAESVASLAKVVSGHVSDRMRRRKPDRRRLHARRSRPLVRPRPPGTC